MTQLHPSHQQRILEDQQTCFADLITNDALLALLEWEDEQTTKS